MKQNLLYSIYPLQDWQLLSSRTLSERGIFKRFMPKLVSIRPTYKILTSNYLSRTLLFFASYADFCSKKSESFDESAYNKLFCECIDKLQLRNRKRNFNFIFNACVFNSRLYFSVIQITDNQNIYKSINILFTKRQRLITKVVLFQV